ncbi:calcium-binding protein, partial [Limnoraphis robusta]
GSATLEEYQTAIGQVVYNNLSQNPNTTTRTIQVFVNDGELNSNTATSSIDIIAVNDPPVLDVDTTTTGTDYASIFTTGGTGTAVVNVGNTSVVDPDNTNIASATVTLVNPPDGVNEGLSVSGLPGGVDANYNTSTNVLNITGSATLAQYETLLGRVIYTNVDPEPDLSDRTVQFVVNDGELNSNTATSVLEFNRPPIANDEGTFITNNRDPFIIDVLANDSDPDGDPLTVSSVTGSGANNVTTDGSVIEYVRITTTGFDQFTYTVSDGRGGIDTGRVGVNIQNFSSDNPQTFTGGTLSDNLNGLGGNDILDGLEGNDTLSGDNDNDNLIGGLGNDSITGGLGVDNLTGGSGRDLFRYVSSEDGGGLPFNASSTDAINTQIGLGQFDVITDFEGLGSTGGDQIKLEFGTTINIVTTVQTDISTNILTEGEAGIFAFDDGSDTYLIYDGDGNNLIGDNSQIIAQLQGVTGITELLADDLIII